MTGFENKDYKMSKRIQRRRIKEHPILFSTEMVRAILDGRKSQTRRVVKPQPMDWSDQIKCEFYHPTIIVRGMQEQGPEVFGFANEDEGWKCPYGQPGDRLWVRETWQNRGLNNKLIYKADFPDSALSKWRPSIHMPRWVSRILLEITDIRVERIQEISEEDAISEGINLDMIKYGLKTIFNNYTEAFIELWYSINLYRGFGWEVNPWVWAITFKRIANEGG